MKMWYLYAMDSHSAIRRKEILPFVTTWMDLEDIRQSKVKQSLTHTHHKQILQDFTRGGR